MLEQGSNVFPIFHAEILWFLKRSTRLFRTSGSPQSAHLSRAICRNGFKKCDNAYLRTWILPASTVWVSEILRKPINQTLLDSFLLFYLQNGRFYFCFVDGNYFDCNNETKYGWRQKDAYKKSKKQTDLGSRAIFSCSKRLCGYGADRYCRINIDLNEM